jgi:UDP-GlcNAc3NAcA epimerase
LGLTRDSSLTIVSVVGARPQFVKAAVVTRAIRQWNAAGREPRINEIIVHTGQHYDQNMSAVFFDDLKLGEPDYLLGISGVGHAAMTGRMLEQIEPLLVEHGPDYLLVYGDTNSTLAGALAAAKIHVPVAHVEAGLRSFNRRMPEEINRVLTDHVAALLLCPSETACANLAREGITDGVQLVGDVMLDASLLFRDAARAGSDVLARLGLTDGPFVLATCHRAENTDDPQALREIVTGLSAIAQRMPVVLPLHPRTRSALARAGLENALPGVTLCEPLSFLDMIHLEEKAAFIVTDSGGVQKEAYFFGVPCITVRTETEWVETVETGWNQVVGASTKAMISALDDFVAPPQRPAIYGDGHAAEQIVKLLAAGGRPG